jgi:hypothetical protein
VTSGSITLTAGSGLTYSFDNGQYGAYPSGGWTGLAANSTHTVSVKNGDGCTSPDASRTIGRAQVNPARPVVTLQEASICGNLTAPTITVSCPIVGTYTLTQEGISGSQTKAYPANNPLVFTVVAGKKFSITVQNTDGCTSDPTNCTNYTSNSCPPPSPVAQMQASEEVIVSKTIVTAAPNPYNEKIRFSITPGVSGRGSLEMYNMLGQKVRTVFEGQVQKGKLQTIEYNVPSAQRANMIYLFKVGNERASGKLINLK